MYQQNDFIHGWYRGEEVVMLVADASSTFIFGLDLTKTINTYDSIIRLVKTVEIQGGSQAGSLRRHLFACDSGSRELLRRIKPEELRIDSKWSFYDVLSYFGIEETDLDHFKRTFKDNLQPTSYIKGC